MGKKSNNQILINVNSILKFKKYIVNYDQRLSCKDKEKAKKIYKIKTIRINKYDYIFYGVKQHLRKIYVHKSKDIYDTLINLEEYKLYDLRFIVENLKVIRNPEIKVLNFLLV